MRTRGTTTRGPRGEVGRGASRGVRVSARDARRAFRDAREGRSGAGRAGRGDAARGARGWVPAQVDNLRVGRYSPGRGTTRKGRGSATARTCPFSKSIDVCSSSITRPLRVTEGAGARWSMMCSAPSHLYTSGWTSMVAADPAISQKRTAADCRHATARGSNAPTRDCGNLGFALETRCASCRTGRARVHCAPLARDRPPHVSGTIAHACGRRGPRLTDTTSRDDQLGGRNFIACPRVVARLLPRFWARFDGPRPPRRPPRSAHVDPLLERPFARAFESSPLPGASAPRVIRDVRRRRRNRPPSTSPARNPNPSRAPPAKPRPTPPVSTPGLHLPRARASRRDIPCRARSPTPRRARRERPTSRPTPTRRLRLGRIFPNVRVLTCPFPTMCPSSFGLIPWWRC